MGKCPISLPELKRYLSDSLREAKRSRRRFKTMLRRGWRFQYQEELVKFDDNRVDRLTVLLKNVRRVYNCDARFKAKFLKEFPIKETIPPVIRHKEEREAELREAKAEFLLREKVNKHKKGIKT